MATKGDGCADTCGICLSRFNNPKILPCFHTYCCQCLQQLLSQSGENEELKCPACRHVVSLPEGGVTKLQTNFYVEAKIEKNRRSCEESNCSVCDQKASHVCHECDILLCDSCVKHHKIIPASRGHALIVLTDELVISKDVFCEKHKEEKLRFYCKVCETVICLFCKLTAHEHHATVDVSDVVVTARQSLTKTKTKLESCLLTTEETLKLINDDEAATQSLIENTKQELNNVADDVVNIVNRIRREGLAKLEDIARENNVKKVKEVVTRRKEFLNSQVSHIVNMLSYGLDSDIITVDVDMKNRLPEVENDSLEVPSVHDLTGDITQPLIRLESIRCYAINSGEDNTRTVPSFEEHGRVKKQFVCGNGEVRSIQVKEENKKYIVASDLNEDGKEYYLLLYSENCMQTKIEISKNSFEHDSISKIVRDYSAVMEAKCEKTFDELQPGYFETYVEDEIEKMAELQTEYFEEEIYTTGTVQEIISNDELSVCTESDEGLPDLSKINEEFNGIKENSRDTDNGLHLPEICPHSSVNNTGSRNTDNGEKENLHADINSRGDKCVADHGKNCVRIELAEGISKIININPFSKPADTFEPQDVCWGKDNEIYIVDCGSNMIFVYHLEERILKKLVIHGEMLFPSCVAMDTDGMLWIGQTCGGVAVCEIHKN